jgi:tetratricopeptide (TPR) repeat protein
MEAQLAAQFEEMDSAARQLEQDRILEQYALAAERLDAAVERRDSAEAHYLLGLSLHRQGQLEAAEDQYLAALAADAEDAEAALQLALLLQARASAENEALLLRAVDYYEKAARLGRLEPEATPSFAFALAGIGAYQRANDLLAQQFGEAPSPEENEQMTPFDLQRYEIALMSERIAALEDQATQIERQAPGSAESVLLRAQAALMEERYLRASYLLEEYRRVRPDDLGGWLILGAARAGMGAAESFLEEYPEPPTDAPGSQSPWFQLARITAMNDFWDAALTYLREGPAAEEAPLPLVAMGDVAAALGQRERAYEYLRQATEAHPEASSPWLKLFDLSLADGNLAAAQGYLDEAGGRGADTELLEARSAALQEAREARGEERPLTIIR